MYTYICIYALRAASASVKEGPKAVSLIRMGSLEKISSFALPTALFLISNFGEIKLINLFININIFRK